MTKIPNQKTRQKRKFLLILPLLTLPFLTLTFWAMGGGSGTSTGLMQTQPVGINLDLPGLTTSKTKELDKLGHYQKSRSDSAKFLQEVKNDPYYRMAFNPESISAEVSTKLLQKSEQLKNTNTPKQEYQDPNEQLVMEKLAVLNQTLSQNEKLALPTSTANKSSVNSSTSHPDLSSDLDRLDLMMQQMQTGNETEDPELQQMSLLLEQILDIQHPERVQQRIRDSQNLQQSQVFSVTKASDTHAISSLEAIQEIFSVPTKSAASNGFYGLESPSLQIEQANSIKAVIHETQTLVSGATVKLRLTEPASINGLAVPKDQLLVGTASLNGERLTIDITHIRINDRLLPVALAVHDADGMAGIYIPGSLSREVGAQSGDRAIQGFGIPTFDTSLEAQAASAGIETAKSFLAKKIKQVKVTLKAGYQVWLNDENKNTTLLNH